MTGEKEALQEPERVKSYTRGDKRGVQHLPTPILDAAHDQYGTPHTGDRFSYRDDLVEAGELR